MQYISYREFFLDSYCTYIAKKQSIRSILRECLRLLQNGLTELYIQLHTTSLAETLYNVLIHNDRGRTR